VYDLKILNNGTWTAPGTVIYSHAYGRHDPVLIVQNFFLLTSSSNVVLVDTGLDNPESYLSASELARIGAPTGRSTAELLREHGVEPEDVDTLIFTHLHFDHYANARLFDRARLVVNRNEFMHVMDPGSQRYAPRCGFPREVFAWLVDEAWERLELVEGETAVLPGIRTIETGGHSPGHQIVLVQSRSGPVVIPGDEIYLYDNLEERIPIGYYYDFEKLTQAMDLLGALGGSLLPAHDPEVHRRFPASVVPSP
jgi:glyoxylase-like metal-dependent hydrolase (beta-lactamase superfamily II)